MNEFPGTLLWRSIPTMYVYQVLILYTLNLYNVLCQLYLNKGRGDCHFQGEKTKNRENIKKDIILKQKLQVYILKQKEISLL